MNVVMMARANRVLGPRITMLYFVLQPVMTWIADYVFLRDAVRIETARVGGEGGALFESLFCSFPFVLFVLFRFWKRCHRVLRSCVYIFFLSPPKLFKKGLYAPNVRLFFERSRTDFSISILSILNLNLNLNHLNLMVRRLYEAGVRDTGSQRGAGAGGAGGVADWEKRGGARVVSCLFFLSAVIVIVNTWDTWGRKKKTVMYEYPVRGGMSAHCHAFFSFFFLCGVCIALYHGHQI